VLLNDRLVHRLASGLSVKHSLGTLNAEAQSVLISGLMTTLEVEVESPFGVKILSQVRRE